MRPMRIDEAGAGPQRLAPAPETRAGGDWQDALLVAGFVCLETGVAFIYWPAALILAGLLFFLFAFLIERAKRIKPHGNPEQ